MTPQQGSDETTVARGPLRPMAIGLSALSVAMLVLSQISDGNAFSDSWWLVAFVVWLMLWGLLRSMTRGLGERPVAGLDERERDVRNRVAFIGYQCAVGAGMLVVLIMVAFQNKPEVIERIPALLTTLMLTSAALPSILLGLSGMDGEETETFGDE
ncbi:hypothetical protein OG875_20885 [Streptomyces sp. NBC_01498]|uniref:hypothetical protein n=1 Tax=Streptomyces sp. NBC_01498 TaxID=2975870 RepID=UPI002E7B9A50|nr:hypothetical protein [Streptomyces sp. NBC_01498]WTL26803.1 hypothetical protein OG875_20885 [Streptomyces sp. NBC_01498]